MRTYSAQYMEERARFLDEGGFFVENDAANPTIIIAAKVVRRNMIEIAVAYCRDTDTPDTHIGQCVALDMFMSGQTILIKNNTTHDAEYVILDVVEGLSVYAA